MRARVMKPAPKISPSCVDANPLSYLPMFIRLDASAQVTSNLPSPSRNRSRMRPTPNAVDPKVIHEYVATHEIAPFSGRGGIDRQHRPLALATSTATSPVRHTTMHIFHTVHSKGCDPGKGTAAQQAAMASSIYPRRRARGRAWRI